MTINCKVLRKGRVKGKDISFNDKKNKNSKNFF